MKWKYDKNELIAIILFKLGFKYKVSMDISGSYTYGYGKLDSNGFWKYQIPYRYIFKYR